MELNNCAFYISIISLFLPDFKFKVLSKRVKTESKNSQGRLGFQELFFHKKDN